MGDRTGGGDGAASRAGRNSAWGGMEGSRKGRRAVKEEKKKTRARVKKSPVIFKNKTLAPPAGGRFVYNIYTGRVRI